MLTSAFPCSQCLGNVSACESFCESELGQLNLSKGLHGFSDRCPLVMWSCIKKLQVDFQQKNVSFGKHCVCVGKMIYSPSCNSMIVSVKYKIYHFEKSLYSSQLFSLKNEEKHTIKIVHISSHLESFDSFV